MDKNLKTEKTAPVHRDTSAEDRRIFALAEQMMRDGKAYRDPKIELYEMAKGIGTLRNHLSRAVNNCAGKNFPGYVNSYRIAEAVELLHHRNKYTPTVEAIRRQVGFASRTAFHTALKELTGLSATEITAGAKVKINVKNDNK